MKLNLGKHEFSIIWEGVYYKALENYPNISKWELHCINDFITYEKKHGRTVGIECEDEHLIKVIKENTVKEEKVPNFISECTACLHKGCHTDYVCHIASLEATRAIFKCGSLLSSTRSRGVSAEILASEDRNAAKDPLDFFDYVMFSWGNCQAGDRLITERMLNRLPSEEDLSIHFKPGIRFYFNYTHLSKHPNATHDGYHAIKVKDEVQLSDYVDKIIIPEMYEDTLKDLIPSDLIEHVRYLDSSNHDIWSWAHKVYEYLMDK